MENSATDKRDAQLFPLITPPDQPRTSSEIIRAGQTLMMAKELYKGSFGSWVKTHCSFSTRTAQNYMNRARSAEATIFENDRTAVMPSSMPFNRVDHLNSDEVAQISDIVSNRLLGTGRSAIRSEERRAAAIIGEIGAHVPHSTKLDVMRACDVIVADRLSDIREIKALKELLASLPDGTLWSTQAAHEAVRNIQLQKRPALAKDLDANNFAAIPLRRRAMAGWCDAARYIIKQVTGNETSIDASVEDLTEELYCGALELPDPGFPSNESELEINLQHLQEHAKKIAYDKRLECVLEYWCWERFEQGLCLNDDLSADDQEALMRQAHAAVEAGDDDLVLRFWPNIPARPDPEFVPA